MIASSMHHQSFLLLYLLIISLSCVKMNRVIGFSAARACRRRRAPTSAMTNASPRRHHSTLATTTSTWEPSQRHNSFLLASVNNDNEQSTDSQQQDLVERIEEEIARNNFDKHLNVNSPKQVSMAIFGTVQSTSKQELIKASQGEGVEFERQQELAKLVLQHRSLTRTKVKRERNKENVTPKTQFIEEEQVGINGEVANLVNEDSKDPTESVTPMTKTVFPHEQVVDSLFDAKSSKLHSYWKDALLQVAKPSAQNLVLQLNAQQCPAGYDPSVLPTLKSKSTPSQAGKKGSLLHYMRQQKEKYNDCIILTRVGEFYETIGMDAVLLVEHCGLNAMGGKAKAGCPIQNVQATLDCLTSRGFRVAVYEEIADTDSSSGPGQKARIKNRMLAQIVSSVSPTYLYDLVLSENADALVTSTPSRPYVGILQSAAGYTLVQVNAEEQTVRISERLTSEAVACHLAAYPPADPLVYVPSSTKSGTTALPFLPSKSDAASDGPGSRLRLKVLPASLIEEPTAGVSDIERARRTIVGAFLTMMEQEEDNDHAAKVNDFVLVASSSTSDDVSTTGTQVNPLYVETATQLGLMSDKTIPPLVSHLLPDSAPAASRRFLRRWLLTPPPPNVADSMSTVVNFLKDSGPALPPLTVPPIGKILALLRAGQASAQVFSELLSAMDATIAFLDTLQNDDYEDVISPLMTLLEYESGIAADPLSLRARCVEAIGVIEAVISPIHHVGNTWNDADDNVSDFGDLIPQAFFERNEARWRGRVQSAAAEEAYSEVQKAAYGLAKAVAVDFWGLDENASMQDLLQEAHQLKSPIVQDIFNNIFCLKTLPSWFDASTDELQSKYFHPPDRNGKMLQNRYTSVNVQGALSEYVAACDQACLDVTSVLTKLSRILSETGHLPAIVQAAHANLILSTAANHAANANILGWNSAATYESETTKSAGNLNGVWPYWMDQSEAVSNSFEMDGLFLLTAPNMSGKSTLMRSTAAAALLVNCGLCAPLGQGSTIQRFDNIFVRGASSDIPTEGKSAFGAEMGDIAALLRSCGDKSLVFVDELARGTSPREGTCLAGAVLEAMAQAGMNGVFASHLHDVLDLPIQGRDLIRLKRMTFDERLNGDTGPKYVWTYKMDDGFCTDSLALVTAAKFGLPENILERAKFFGSSIVERDDVSMIVDPMEVEEHKMLGKGEASKNRDSKLEHTLQRATHFAEEISGGSAIRIPPRWTCPPALEGCSCVYILELGNDRFYVGETDSLRQRLQQHRNKGGEWKSCTAVAICIAGGKSQARRFETLLIRKLAQTGFTLESISDGRVVRSTGRSVILPDQNV